MKESVKNMGIEDILDKNEKLILKIKHNGKDYIKVITKDLEYTYYEILERTIKPVQEKNLIEYFKNMYEIKQSNIVY